MDCDDEFGIDEIDESALMAAVESAENVYVQGSSSSIISNNKIKRQQKLFESLGLETDFRKPTVKIKPAHTKAIDYTFGYKDDKIKLHPIDKETQNNWIYPTNLPIREYQLKIVERSLFSNSIICYYFFIIQPSSLCQQALERQ